MFSDGHLDSCSGVSGWASGADSAAATTSSSVMASSRAQSVSPRGNVSPGFTVTRVVPVLLMSCGLSGRYDSATILATQCDDHEQDVSLSHSDDLNPLLVAYKMGRERDPLPDSQRCQSSSRWLISKELGIAPASHTKLLHLGLPNF